MWYTEEVVSGHKEFLLLKEQLKVTQKELNRIKKELIKFEKNWIKVIIATDMEVLQENNKLKP